MLHLRAPDKSGEKKLEGDGFYIYFLSASGPGGDHEAGIEDDIARDVAEKFVEMCGGSSHQIGSQLVAMSKRGGIPHHTDSGTHYFHIKRRRGSSISLELTW